MASELFGSDWIQKMEEEHDEATRQFKAAVASARSGSDEAVRQNMIMLEKALPPLHEAVRSMSELLESDKNASYNRAASKRFLIPIIFSVSDLFTFHFS